MFIVSENIKMPMTYNQVRLEDIIRTFESQQHKNQASTEEIRKNLKLIE